MLHPARHGVIFLSALIFQLCPIGAYCQVGHSVFSACLARTEAASAAFGIVLSRSGLSKSADSCRTWSALCKSDITCWHNQNVWSQKLCSVVIMLEHKLLMQLCFQTIMQVVHRPYRISQQPAHANGTIENSWFSQQHTTQTRKVSGPARQLDFKRKRRILLPGRQLQAEEGKPHTWEAQEVASYNSSCGASCLIHGTCNEEIARYHLLMSRGCLKK